MDKPDVDFIEGSRRRSRSIRSGASRNPRSTVGTVTEIYDYLRLLYARIGIPHCPKCGRVITRQTRQQIVDAMLQLEAGKRFMVLAPVMRERKGEHQHALRGRAAARASFASGSTASSRSASELRLERDKQHTVEVVVDRLVRRRPASRGDRLADSLETALQAGRRHRRGRDRVKASRGARDPPSPSTSPARTAASAFGRARTAQLLVQQPARRLRGPARVSAHDGDRSGARGPEQRLSTIANGAITLVGIGHEQLGTAVLIAVAQEYGSRPTTPFEELNPEPAKKIDPLRQGRQTGHGHSTNRYGASAIRTRPSTTA